MPLRQGHSSRRSTTQDRSGGKPNRKHFPNRASETCVFSVSCQTNKGLGCDTFSRPALLRNAFRLQAFKGRVGTLCPGCDRPGPFCASFQATGFHERVIATPSGSAFRLFRRRVLNFRVYRVYSILTPARVVTVPGSAECPRGI